MESIGDALDGHAVIGIDTPIFIYYVETSDRRAQAAGHILGRVASGRARGVTSVVTLAEVATSPFRLNQPDLADDFRELITSLPPLTVAPLDVETAMLAARLRAVHSLRTPDALQIAACLEHGATAFVTNDRRLRSVTELSIVVLDDVIPS